MDTRRPELLATCKRFTLLLWLGLLTACGGGGSGGSSNETVNPPTAVPFGLQQRESLKAPRFSIQQQDLAGVALNNAFPGLPIGDAIVFLTALPNTDRLLLVQQSGVISSFVNAPTANSSESFLDISGRVQSGGEEGLLGLAFAPDYSTSGHFYVYYSAANPRRSILARYQRDPNNALRGNPDSEEVLLEVEQPFANHNAGMLAFGPDGMLYVALGDGGSGGDPNDNGQNRQTLLGSLLRIDVSNGAYSIPADNPFIDDPQARGEIWAYGLRNPYRFSFDRLTGDLWTGDVGENEIEEVDIITRGGNYGWRVFEGNSAFNDSTNELPDSAFTRPVLAYDHSEGNSVTGGYVYRGSTAPALQGRYIYGDFGSGTVWALDYNGTQVVSNQTIGNVSSLSSFGEDASGELYALSYSGSIFRFEQGDSGEPQTAPALLSATGLFADIVSLEPLAGLIEYSVQAPYWHDGASHQRWLGVPDGQQIQFSENDSWAFPIGTVIAQQVNIELNVGDPASARRLETRVLVNTGSGWRGFTYRWNADQNDANLLENGADESLLISDADAPGGQREHQYRYPTEAECLRCHTEATGRVAGVNTRQLNSNFDYAAATDNQLRSLNNISLFSSNIAVASTLPSMPDPFDTAEPLETRAKAYLDVNCAYCHQPGGPTPGNFDLRFSTALAAMNVLDTPGAAGSPAETSPVTRGDRNRSEIWLRMQGQSGQRMPPLETAIIDDRGVALIGEWIDSLE